MRGDFEILGYNMIQWLCGTLLWEKNLSDAVAVQKQKEKAFDNIPEFLNKSFQGSVPAPVLKYMTLLASVQYNEAPNYDRFVKILTDGLKELSHKPDGKLEFKSSDTPKNDVQKSTPQRVKKPVDGNRKSPRVKPIKPINLKPKSLHTPSSLDESTVGIVIDKKRGGVRDIKEILQEIESDEEYDIKIVKKARKPNNIASDSKEVKSPPKNRRRIKKIYDDSISDESEPEIISKGTRSRPTARKVLSPKNSRKALIDSETASDEDMFSM